MLAHYTNLPRYTENDEPLYSNLFEVTFTFPESLTLDAENQDIMMVSATNIDLPLTPELNTVTQSFKYSGRLYLTTPKDTILSDISIKFNINVDHDGSMRTWNLLKKWYDLGWNSQTGSLHYKRNMVGTIVSHIHDREGVVIRRTEFKNVQMKGITGMEFSWAGNDILSCTAKFCADYWIDLYRDIQLS